MNSTNFNIPAFLRALGTLPQDCRPALLRGVAALAAAKQPEAESAEQAAPVERVGRFGERLNRRYLRVRAVQDELGKLNFKKAKPGAALDDFVFEQTDFSAYKKIGLEEFSLFSAGLEDFDDSFYARSFRMDRKKTENVINGAYKRIGGFYYIKQEQYLYNPLLMAVIRTLHTSLAFAPVVSQGELRAEFLNVVRYLEENRVIEKGAFLSATENFNPVYRELLELLGGRALLHSDGMATTLSVEKDDKGLILKGCFNPRDKAYTMVLAEGSC
ncbi:MAG: hypothetical protein LBT16_07310 [Treponema sp.]|jgi:hypothetical protein|nr:hypothetical protein [Treponema sp.]